LNGAGADKSAQRRADHLPGGRQERSGSANALKRRFLTQVRRLGERRVSQHMAQYGWVTAIAEPNRPGFCVFRGSFI